MCRSVSVIHFCTGRLCLHVVIPRGCQLVILRTGDLVFPLRIVDVLLLCTIPSRCRLKQKTTQAFNSDSVVVMVLFCNPAWTYLYKQHEFVTCHAGGIWGVLGGQPFGRFPTFSISDPLKPLKFPLRDTGQIFILPTTFSRWIYMCAHTHTHTHTHTPIYRYRL